MKEKLNGLLSAPHTPFNEDGSVKLSEIEKIAELAVSQGLKGVYICGTTGEGIHMSVEERKAVAEKWMEASAGRLFVIVHTGALSIADSKELTRHAAAIKADAISVIGPCFFKPACVEDLVDYCAEICAEAPETPFYYYHSGMSGVAFDMCQFLPLAAEKIPTMAGLKFNWNDLYAYQRCVALDGGKYDISWGVDEVYAGGMIYGAKSAVGSTYNYMPEKYVEMKKAFEAGDMATVDAISKKVLEVIDILIEFGGVQAGKAIMSIHGIDCGTVRRPLRPLTAEQKEEVVKRFKAIWA